MDAAKGGVNFKIAEKLGLRNLRFFGGEKEIDGVKGGEGVIGEITDEADTLHADGIAADDLVLMLRERFLAECVQCNQLLRRPIRKVALCGGAGSFLLDAAIAAGADAFITGEMHYHEFSAMSRKSKSASSVTIRANSLRAKSSAALSRKNALE